MAGADFVDGLRRCSPQAHAELFRRYYARILRLVHRMLGKDTELDDAVQEIFVRVMQAAPKFRGTEDNLEPWLIQIAVMTTRTLIRKRVVRRKFFFIGEPENETAAPMSDAEDVDTLRRLYRALDKLSVKIRIPFALRLIERMSLPEIAHACDVSEATVKRRIAEAKVRFETLVVRDPVLSKLGWLPEASQTTTGSAS